MSETSSETHGGCLAYFADGMCTHLSSSLPSNYSRYQEKPFVKRSILLEPAIISLFVIIFFYAFENNLQIQLSFGGKIIALDENIS